MLFWKRWRLCFRMKMSHTSCGDMGKSRCMFMRARDAIRLSPMESLRQVFRRRRQENECSASHELTRRVHPIGSRTLIDGNPSPYYTTRKQSCRATLLCLTCVYFTSQSTHVIPGYSTMIGTCKRQTFLIILLKRPKASDIQRL